MTEQMLDIGNGSTLLSRRVANVFLRLCDETSVTPARPNAASNARLFCIVLCPPNRHLSICRDMMAQIGENRLVLVEMILFHYQRLTDQGYGGYDISVLFTLRKKLFERGEA